MLLLLLLMLLLLMVQELRLAGRCLLILSHGLWLLLLHLILDNHLSLDKIGLRLAQWK
jgi:hypothetical protein